MRLYYLLFIMAIVGAFIGYSNAETFSPLYCGKYKCPKGNKCCYKNLVGYYNQCYNPTTHSCYPDQYKPYKNCLCGYSEKCCNGVCYNPYKYYCDTKGKIKKKVYTPPTKKCGIFKCGKHDLCCHKNIIGTYYDVCYSPYTHVCITDDYYHKKHCLCAKGNGCCKGVCYNTDSYKCVYGKVVQKH